MRRRRRPAGRPACAGVQGEAGVGALLGLGPARLCGLRASPRGRARPGTLSALHGMGASASLEVSFTVICTCPIKVPSKKAFPAWAQYLGPCNRTHLRTPCRPAGPVGLCGEDPALLPRVN